MKVTISFMHVYKRKGTKKKIFNESWFLRLSKETILYILNETKKLHNIIIRKKTCFPTTS